LAILKLVGLHYPAQWKLDKRGNVGAQRIVSRISRYAAGHVNFAHNWINACADPLSDGVRSLLCWATTLLVPNQLFYSSKPPGWPEFELISGIGWSESFWELLETRYLRYGNSLFHSMNQKMLLPGIGRIYEHEDWSFGLLVSLDNLSREYVVGQCNFQEKTFYWAVMSWKVL
jgi:hypothetical protein